MARSEAPVEQIALRFSPDDINVGYGALHALPVSPLRTLSVGGNIVYAFDSSHWLGVQQALAEAQVPYSYQQSPRIPRAQLEDPEQWHPVNPAELINP